MFQNARQANPAPQAEAKRIGGNRLCFRFLSVISFGRAPEGAAAERCPRPRSAKTEPAESAELRRNCTRKKPMKHQIPDARASLCPRGKLSLRTVPSDTKKESAGALSL